jgi:hypothetical protein
MTEFAVVAPVMLLTLLGILEGGILMFGINNARFGAGEIARVVAQQGSTGTPDLDAIVYANNRTALGQTNVVSVNWVEIYRCYYSGGTLVRDNSKVNRWTFSSTPNQLLFTWPYGSRNVSAYNGEFVGVDVNYTYYWKDGIIGSLTPAFTSTATVRLHFEPQVY